MKAVKLISMLFSVIGCLAFSSCSCCTGEEKAPKLRSLPKFNAVPVPVVAEETVEPAK